MVRCNLPGEASSHEKLLLLQVSMTIGQPLGQADLWPNVPNQERHLLAQNGTTSGQHDYWSAFGSG